MKEVTVIKKAPPAAAPALDAYEREQGIRLPDDLRCFLLTLNAIDIKETLMKDGEQEFYIDRFFPFEGSGELSLQSVNAMLREFFENRYLTFACDSGGWQFVISVQESDYGKVYFCRMDKSPAESLRLIANSFTDFLQRLRSW